MRVVTGVGDIGPPPWDCSSHKYRTQGLPGRQRAAPSVLSLDSGIYMSGRSLRRAGKVGHGGCGDYGDYLELVSDASQRTCSLVVVMLNKFHSPNFLHISEKVSCGYRKY